jgi:hypothetical protein
MISCENSCKKPTKQLLADIHDLLIKMPNTVLTQGRTHHKQQRGSCAAKVIASWLKGELMERQAQTGKDLYVKMKAFRTKQDFQVIDNIIKALGIPILVKVLGADGALDVPRLVRAMRDEAFEVLRKRERKAGIA